jgi:chromate reductase, NAD(P)H dehydrogenase (quinone)
VKIFNILGINGSASSNSSNLRLLTIIGDLAGERFNLEILDDLSVLPHFRTELTNVNTPKEIIDFRNKIKNADGVIICTPEYVFSIPSGLKNAIEWCVSTDVFSDKPLGLITASANGEKGHEELKLIMQTVQTVFTAETTLLVPGIKGRLDANGEPKSAELKTDLEKLVSSFIGLIEN